MPYPFRQCRCGNQIHVGSRYLCDTCVDIARSVTWRAESTLDDLLACRPGGVIHMRQIAPNPADVPNRLFGTTLTPDGDAI